MRWHPGVFYFISYCIVLPEIVRNLFAIDYMKDHPGTTVADFKVVFNSIDKETKRVFDVIPNPATSWCFCSIEIWCACEVAKESWTVLILKSVGEQNICTWLFPSRWHCWKNGLVWYQQTVDIPPALDRTRLKQLEETILMTLRRSKRCPNTLSLIFFARTDCRMHVDMSSDGLDRPQIDPEMCMYSTEENNPHQQPGGLNSLSFRWGQQNLWKAAKICSSPDRVSFSRLFTDCARAGFTGKLQVLFPLCLTFMLGAHLKLDATQWSWLNQSFPTLDSVCKAFNPQADEWPRFLTDRFL